MKPPTALTSDQQRARSLAVENILECIQGAPPEKARGDLWLQRTVPNSRVVSVLGGRGTGKTTVLESVIYDLQRQSHDIFPLPILDATIASREDSMRYYIAQVLDTVEADNVDGGHSAKSAVRELRAHMVGTDPGWRTASAQLSATQGDYGLYAEMRAESTLSYATKLGHAVRMVSDLLGKQFLLFTIDDLDLAPQRLLDVFAVLNELRYVPNAVVLLAADLEDAHLRIFSELWKQLGISRAELPFEPHSPNQINIPRGEWIKAERIVAKLIPERHRCYIGMIPPGFRSSFPPSTPSALTEPSSNPHSIGSRLLGVGLASHDTLAWRSTDQLFPAPRAPQWDYVLAPTPRTLAAYQFGDAPDRLAAKERNLLREQRKAHARSPTSTKRTGTRNDTIPTSGRVPQETVHGLAVVARLAGLTEWASELDIFSEAPLTGANALDVLVRRNFDLSAHFESTNNMLSECTELSRATAEGTALQRWLPPRTGRELASKLSAQHPDAHIGHFAPLCIDVCLRYLPQQRLPIMLHWSFSRAVLASVSVRVLKPNRRSATEISMLDFFSILHRLANPQIPGTELHMAWPIATSWADMMETLEEFARLPRLTEVHWPKDTPGPRLPLRDLAALGRWHPGLTSADGYLCFLVGLLRLKQIRCELSEQRSLSIFAGPRINAALSTTELSIAELLLLLARSPAEWNKPDEVGPSPANDEPRVNEDDAEELPFLRDSYDAKTRRSSTYTMRPHEVWQQFLMSLPKQRLLGPDFWLNAYNDLKKTM